MAETDRSARAANANPTKGEAEDKNEPRLSALSRFLDVPMTVGVRLDRRSLKVRSMLALKPDSVIKLNRSAGEKVDLLLDGLQIGAGEIVVIEDMMGLRITDLFYNLGEQK